MYPVSLHLGMFMRMPDQLLNFSTMSSIRISAGIVAATRVASSAYHLLVKERLFDVSVYPFCVDFIHLIRGSTMSINMSGERESPWIVPLRIWRRRFHPCGVRNFVCASKYRLATIMMKSSGMPRKPSMRVS